jgi:hypothetical protein
VLNLIKKIGFLLLVIVMIFTSACSAVTGIADKDNQETFEESIIKIDGTQITQREFEDARTLILINNFIVENNISVLKKAIDVEKDEKKRDIYKAQLTLEEQKLINSVTNSLVTQEIVSRMVLYNEAINYGQAIGPNNANLMSQALKEKYSRGEYEDKAKILRVILEGLSIEEDYYWGKLERDNIMYKTSIRNLKNKLAKDYIENNYSDEADKPTLNEILRDNNFAEFYETFKQNAIKKSAVKIKRGYN